MYGKWCNLEMKLLYTLVKVECAFHVILKYSISTIKTIFEDMRL